MMVMFKMLENIHITRGIPAFVIYYVYGAPGSSLLIESTAAMIIIYSYVNFRIQRQSKAMNLRALHVFLIML